MQKKLLAAAVLSAFSGAAAAQSANVTIYGTLFSDLENASSTGGDSTTGAQAVANGAVSTFRTSGTALNTGTTSNLGNGSYVTGAAGAAGAADPSSRFRLMGSGANFGLRGTEDLGNGLSAWFQLEMGTASAMGGGNASSATSAGGYQALTYRNSAIGLKSNTWGSILMGIWDTPLTVAYGQTELIPKFLSINSTNTQAGFFGTNPFVGGGTFSGTSMVQACTLAGAAGATIGGSAAGCLTSTMNMDRRQADTMQWWSPNWNGFEGRLMFTPSAENYGASLNNLATPAYGTNSFNTLKPYMWGLSANYSNGGLVVSYSYQRLTDITAAGVRQFGGIGLNNITTGGYAVSLKGDMSGSTDDDHRLGAKYKFDSGFGIGARYEWMRGVYQYGNAPVANTSDLTGYKKKAWGISGSYENGPHSVMLEYDRSPNITVTGTQGVGANVGSLNGAATDAHMWVLAYDYALSKRTDVRAYFTSVTNDTNARYQGTVFNGLQPVAGGDPRYVGVGLRHAF